MSATVVLHPAMTGQEANAWCLRYSSQLEVTHRQGKVHLLVIANPKPSGETPCPQKNPESQS